MMAELGGPLPKESVPEKLRRDVEAVRRDESWITVIESDDGDAMGTVVLWEHEDRGETISEIGWMVLPESRGEEWARRPPPPSSSVHAPTADWERSTPTRA